MPKKSVICISFPILFMLILDRCTIWGRSFIKLRLKYINKIKMLVVVLSFHNRLHYLPFLTFLIDLTYIFLKNNPHIADTKLSTIWGLLSLFDVIVFYSSVASYPIRISAAVPNILPASASSPAATFVTTPYSLT